MATLNFDASQVAPAVAPEAIPSGWYQTYIIESEIAATSKGDGSVLKLTHSIVGGQFNGHKLYDRINMQNSNPVAVRIGQEQLSAICHATGVIQCQDSAQLHNRPMMVKVSMRPAGPGADGKHYDASNEVKGYKSLAAAGAMAATQMAPAQAMPPAPPAAAQWTPPPQQQWTPPAQQQAPAPAPQQWTPPPAQQQAPVQQAPVQQAQVQQAQVQQAQVQQTQVQQTAMPPWAAAPAPAAEPAPAPVQQAAPQQAPAATPPWVQQPAQ